jgi:hypothetical protein
MLTQVLWLSSTGKSTSTLTASTLLGAIQLPNQDIGRTHQVPAPQQQAPALVLAWPL